MKTRHPGVRVALKRSLRIIPFVLVPWIFTGCIVLSLNPFYTKASLIELPQIQGEWVLLKDAGEDVTQTNIKPWVFRDDTIRTVDKQGVSSILRVKYFKFADATFMDTTVVDPEVTNQNKWWMAHVTPVHIVCKVHIEDEVLTLIPLNSEWLEDAIENKEVSLPYIMASDEDLPVFTATPEAWMSLLERYRGDTRAFSAKFEYVLKRHRE